MTEEDDSDVFSSVEVQRAAEQAPAGTPPERVTGPTPAIRASGAIPAPTLPPPRALPRLTVETAGRPGSRAVEVTADVFTIGRHDADLEIDDQYVAPLHAMIRLDSGAVFLQDTGSQNGVYLRIADDLALEDWDEIAVGTQRFVFRTSWDTPREQSNPNKPRTLAIGGNVPGDAARLIQTYSGGQIGGICRVFDRVTIGRTNSDVCEPDDQWLAAPHATIERRGQQFFIKDASSQLGTFIRLLDSVELIDGDVFMVGRTRIKIEYP